MAALLAAARVWDQYEKQPGYEGSQGSCQLKCKLCSAQFKGTLTRAREHLAGVGGNVAPCQQVEAKQPLLRPLLVAEITAKKSVAQEKAKVEGFVSWDDACE
jgi:hypothetical protein